MKFGALEMLDILGDRLISPNADVKIGYSQTYMNDGETIMENEFVKEIQSYPLIHGSLSIYENIHSIREQGLKAPF